ncbi:MAG: hypothetical protein ABIA21_01995 [Candidatus Aenigmatarchaeota archaeon]
MQNNYKSVYMGALPNGSTGSVAEALSLGGMDLVSIWDTTLPVYRINGNGTKKNDNGKYEISRSFDAVVCGWEDIEYDGDTAKAVISIDRPHHIPKDLIDFLPFAVVNLDWGFDTYLRQHPFDFRENQRAMLSKGDDRYQVVKRYFNSLGLNVVFDTGLRPTYIGLVCPRELSTDQSISSIEDFITCYPKDSYGLLPHTSGGKVSVYTEPVVLGRAIMNSFGGNHIKVKGSRGATESKMRKCGDGIIEIIETGQTLIDNNAVLVESVLISTPFVVINEKRYGALDPERKKFVDNITGAIQTGLAILEEKRPSLFRPKTVYNGLGVGSTLSR